MVLWAPHGHIYRFSLQTSLSTSAWQVKGTAEEVRPSPGLPTCVWAPKHSSACGCPQGPPCRQECTLGLNRPPAPYRAPAPAALIWPLKGPLGSPSLCMARGGWARSPRAAAGTYGSHWNIGGGAGRLFLAKPGTSCTPKPDGLPGTHPVLGGSRHLLSQTRARQPQCSGLTVTCAFEKATYPKAPEVWSGRRACEPSWSAQQLSRPHPHPEVPGGGGVGPAQAPGLQSCTRHHSLRKKLLWPGGTVLAGDRPCRGSTCCLTPHGPHSLAPEWHCPPGCPLPAPEHADCHSLRRTGWE